ncbi:hypothetical protein GQ457_12G027820 [Hibiscus cannabinus]
MKKLPTQVLVGSLMRPERPLWPWGMTVSIKHKCSCLVGAPLPPPSPPQPETASIDIESQPVWPPSQPQLHSQLEASLDVQNHQQWKSAVVAFCFSYALGVSLQFTSLDQTDHRLPFSMVLLSFLVLLTFISILVAPFVHPKCPMILQALQKVALVLAAAAFCHTLSIPFSIELKCALSVLILLGSVAFSLSFAADRSTWWRIPSVNESIVATSKEKKSNHQIHFRNDERNMLVPLPVRSGHQSDDRRQRTTEPAVLIYRPHQYNPDECAKALLPSSSQQRMHQIRKCISI